jgi:hypothetical protein
MAVQILIHRNGGKVVFDSPANAQQSDLLFWRNGDSEAHFPIPGCEKLQVAPGKSTAQSPYVPFADTTSHLPLTVSYGCAIHPDEHGTVVIGPDTPGSPPVGSAAIDPQNVAIHIRRSGGRATFDTIDVAQGDTVYWVNDDTQTHWPVPNCSGLRVNPGQSSNSVQLATANAPRSAFANPALPIAGPPPLPMPVIYGCALPGHEAESGTINVYDNLSAFPATPPDTTPTPAIVTQVGIPVVIVTGGKSPYTVAQDPAHPQLTLSEMLPEGSSNGVAVTLNQPATGTVTVDLQVNVTDGLGKKLNQQLPVTIQGGTN